MDRASAPGGAGPWAAASPHPCPVPPWVATGKGRSRVRATGDRVQQRFARRKSTPGAISGIRVCRWSRANHSGTGSDRCRRGAPILEPGWQEPGAAAPGSAKQRAGRRPSLPATPSPCPGCLGSLPEQRAEPCGRIAGGPAPLRPGPGGSVLPLLPAARPNCSQLARAVSGRYRSSGPNPGSGSQDVRRRCSPVQGGAFRSCLR